MTLAGESGYYTPNSTQLPGNGLSNTVCLAGCQPDPKQPGRTDGTVNGVLPLSTTAAARILLLALCLSVFTRLLL